MYSFLFPFGLFLSACSLFIIQPMVAKILLPVYGGTPAVWTVCVLFFQGLLLVSYGYAWGLSRFRDARFWRITHGVVCLLSLFYLPLSFVPVSGVGSPEGQILGGLLWQLGLPLLVIGASAPLLQYAFANTASRKARDPYFLYVASNMGSLLALLSYPVWVERWLSMVAQWRLWNVLYISYVLLVLGLLTFIGYDHPVSLKKTTSVAWKTRAHWIFLSFIPCSLMLGVTFFISTDVAATPLFWVLPLALYLLSFIVTFASKPLLSPAWVSRNILFFLAFPLLGFVVGVHHLSAVFLISAHLIGFFMLALLCHGELVRLRPPVAELTAFYFCLALGGVLAGLFNGLWAPRWLSHAYEYPLVMLLALFCVPIARPKKISWVMPFCVVLLLIVGVIWPTALGGEWCRSHHVAEIAALSVILIWPGSRYRLFFCMLLLFVMVEGPWFKSVPILSQQRNFYGIKQVFSQQGVHVLLSQSTVHGFQVFSSDVKPVDGARAYYGSVFSIVQLLQREHPTLHSMVIGLGTGMMACQFRQEDKLKMVEIDEQVITMAQTPTLFTYLRDCPPEVSLVKDDGLLAAMRVENGLYDLWVLDAFNSDAIPVHLLTLEAFQLYQKKITADGVILVNISNRHLRLLPVLTGIGHELDMIVLHKFQPENDSAGQLPSEWVLLTRNERLANDIIRTLGWRFVADMDSVVWTNDYSNVVSLLKW